MKISEAIDMTAALLLESGITEARREATSLLGFAIKKDKIFLIAHPDHELDEPELKYFIHLVNRRMVREPFQYIAGRQEFYGLEFNVSADVLIPRPETEILVEQAIRELSKTSKPAFLEIGVGSGCISISVLNELQHAGAVGVDISERALAVTQANAEKHHVEDRLTLRRADLYDGISEKFDLIVSNPPYVPREQISGLQTEVARYEPHIALDGGPGGLVIIERIIAKAPNFLASGGRLLIEIGFGQAESVERLFLPAIWDAAEFINDLQGIPRVVTARLRR